MNLYEHPLYNMDIKYVANLDLPWEKLFHKSILISGATGLIGSFFIDVLMTKNLSGLDCTIHALSRDVQKAYTRFSKWKNDPLFHYVSKNINQPLICEDLDQVDFIIHMASNTHPVQYAIDPIGTITTNIIGLQNMLNFAVDHHAARFVFTSSNEIYGENRGDVEFFDENYCGYINSNTLRAGYPESKRCGEALCQAYRSQKGINVVIPRLTRSYGPTMLMSDTKAISQFFRKAISGKEIVLKSSGTQFYSYTYVADAVSGLLYVFLKGDNGEAYNIADDQSDIMLKDLADLIAKTANTRVVFEIPDSVEAAGYSTATKARLSSDKLKDLGWRMKYNLHEGIQHTFEILSEKK